MFWKDGLRIFIIQEDCWSLGKSRIVHSSQQSKLVPQNGDWRFVTHVKVFHQQVGMAVLVVLHTGGVIFSNLAVLLLSTASPLQLEALLPELKSQRRLLKQDAILWGVRVSPPAMSYRPSDQASTSGSTCTGWIHRQGCISRAGKPLFARNIGSSTRHKDTRQDHTELQLNRNGPLGIEIGSPEAAIPTASRTPDSIWTEQTLSKLGL